MELKCRLNSEQAMMPLASTAGVVRIGLFVVIIKVIQCLYWLFPPNICWHLTRAVPEAKCTWISFHSIQLRQPNPLSGYVAERVMGHE